MIINFKQSEPNKWGDLQAEVSSAIREKLTCGKDWFVSIGFTKPVNDPKFPHIFFFRPTSGKDKLMEIRASVGKELTRRIQDQYFDDFKVVFAPAKTPSDNQRAYYWGVVIPTIQEHFKKEGNFIPQEELHEAIKDVLEKEEGLFIEKISPITGEVYKTRLTISNAGNKADAIKFIDAVIRFAAGYGIVIPEPPEKSV